MNKNIGNKNTPEIWINEESSWNSFSEEMVWFIYDFFRFCLDPFEKLIFYSYYFNGFTLEEISDIMNCTNQYVNLLTLTIEKKLHNRWKTKKYWRISNGS